MHYSWCLEDVKMQALKRSVFFCWVFCLGFFVWFFLFGLFCLGFFCLGWRKRDTDILLHYRLCFISGLVSLFRLCNIVLCFIMFSWVLFCFVVVLFTVPLHCQPPSLSRERPSMDSMEDYRSSNLGSLLRSLLQNYILTGPVNRTLQDVDDTLLFYVDVWRRWFQTQLRKNSRNNEWQKVTTTTPTRHIFYRQVWHIWQNRGTKLPEITSSLQL